MRKIYAAPVAHLISLAPQEPIAAPGWLESGDMWWTKGFFWGIDTQTLNTVSQAAWYDFGLSEITDPITTTD